MSHPIGNHYPRRLLLSVLFTLLSVAGINVLVDPYGLFGTPRIPGFNALKPFAEERVRVIKPYQAEAHQATTIIGGNSRPEMGLDPTSRCWLDVEKPVFNAGTPGLGVHLQIQMIQHTALTGKPTQILLGVDFLDFLDSYTAAPQFPRTTPPSDLEMRLITPNTTVPPLARWRQYLTDHLSALFSLDTLTDAIVTLPLQYRPFTNTRRADGFNPAQNYYPIVQHEGNRLLFRAKNREVYDSLVEPGLTLRNQQGQRSRAFGQLEDLLDWSHQQGIRPILFINPYHAEYLLLVYLTDRWPMLEDWKGELTRIATNHQVPLWDFHSIDAYTTEVPGEQPPGEPLRWFWEPAHYRKELGELMLAQMLNRPCTDVSPLPGTRLSPDTLDTHLHALREALDSHRQSYPQVWERLLALQDNQHGIVQ